jgi:raffinose/stachyose/melibiose transport system substrate-binding protein
MIKHAMKTCLVLMVAFAMITSLMACGAVKTAPNTSSEITPETETKSNEVKKAPVKINYPTYRVGTNVGAAFEVRLLNEFKEKYKDEVELVIEELPSDQIYLDKMKILASSGDVPDLVEGKAGVGEILINANLATPLNEYLDADPQWKAEIGEDAIKANSKDGKCWSISQDRMVIGYYYNKEHFEKVGIKPAETWDEFFDNCEKLKQANITPLTLMTGEDAWTTNLLLISIVGTSGEAGNKLMNEIHATNYNTPEFIDGLKKIQYMLQNYTTSDALGAVYASAANNFLQGKTAIIANGPWMITDFSDTTKTSADFYDKVGVSIYPEGGLFSSFSAGMLLCSKDTERRLPIWT